MKKFGRVQSNIAFIEIDNIDTDMIIPKQFLKTLKKAGLGKSLFYEMRYDESGKIIPSFILNHERYQKTKILLTGLNFGCGSSREHAPWAIEDFGIRVIIANSFAEIFHNNCFKNGILPIVLPKEETDAIQAYINSNKECNFIVDLESQTIQSVDKNLTIKFQINKQNKRILLEGLDDIAETMQNSSMIEEFEIHDKKVRPWIYAEE